MALRLGNTKLGLRIWQWSVPPIVTCPGRSAICEELCYGCRGHYYCPAVQDALARNLDIAESPDFVGWMKTEIRDRAVAEYVRIHANGDCHKVGYVRRWISIVESCPGTTFAMYTRSWRVKRLLGDLRILSRLPNLFLWFSCDRETGAPPLVPGVRRAYMAVDDDDAPRYKVDLVFRVQDKTPMKFDAMGNYVCPTDRGDGHKLTCSNCLACYKEKELPSKWPLQTKTGSMTPDCSSTCTRRSTVTTS